MSTPARLQLSLLGPVEVRRGETVCALPPSKKARGLLAYLVVNRRDHHRARLAELLWDVADDPRGGLRWSTSRLRALIDDDRGKRIVSTRDTLRFAPEGAVVDVDEVQAVLDEGLEDVPLARLRAAAALFRGPFLDGNDQPDLGSFQAWLVGERERWQAAQRDVLGALVRRQGDRPEEALPWARALIDLAPDDETARADLVRLLIRGGHPREAEEHVELARRSRGQDAEAGRPRGPGLVERTFRELVGEHEPAAPVPPSPAPRGAEAYQELARRQEIRFCSSFDGTSLAYATIGAGPPLLKTSNWMTHLEYDWKSPLWRHLAADMSATHTLIRYDQRGNGLSDRDVEDISLEARVRDLEAVVEATGLERFPLLCISQGCALGVTFAVRWPERVSHLILYGGFAHGWVKRSPQQRERREAMLTLMREGWGLDNPAFRQMFTSLFMPDAGPEQMTWFNELQRVSATPHMAARISGLTGDTDIEELLPQVTTPTLVLHARGDHIAPFEEGRILAAGIPGARLVPLESRNHLLLGDEPAWRRFVDEVKAFLAT